ncbi:hypothetical protein HK405_001909, partial [Cladochytrium tenue]
MSSPAAASVAAANGHGHLGAGGAFPRSATPVSRTSESGSDDPRCSSRSAAVSRVDSALGVCTSAGAGPPTPPDAAAADDSLKRLTRAAVRGGVAWQPPVNADGSVPYPKQQRRRRSRLRLHLSDAVSVFEAGGDSDLHQLPIADGGEATISREGNTSES